MPSYMSRLEKPRAPKQENRASKQETRNPTDQSKKEPASTAPLLPGPVVGRGGERDAGAGTDGRLGVAAVEGLA